uniref:RAVE complex protein Rav1 C-terminal domain-containing protein n=1 Tax=Kalanchoe fedtschenkoi TaxID=63787 RepID=A0A7N0UFG9_KALFE
MPRIIDAGDSFAAGDILDGLPHQLVKSEIIPPAPNLTGPAIDFLPDFAGYGWLAYGAASLFVISHFPSPASPAETLIGPIMRQVFELAGYVNAVAWSPVTPCTGEVVVAAENRIALFSHDSESSTGSFGWSQNAVLVQATKVDLVKWTGSGDGIVAGGVEVVFWKNKGRSWEVVWKVRNELPQDLVSTTWSIEGPMATAAAYREDVEGSSSTTSKDRKCVSLIRSTEGFEYTKVELRHPQPITMIQWRPQKRRKLDQDVRQSMRNVLMTCSVDGTVRLWCEVDNGKVNKFVKDVNDQQTLRQSFFVAAVIETNQVLKGSLGFDIYVVWATESQGMIRTPSGNVCFLPEIYGDIGSCKCEWIVGTGPGALITFWAIHCLDDVTPVRCPQVTLWQRQEVPGLGLASCSGVSGSNCNNQSSFNKIFFSRNKLSAPPAVCSLIHLFPGNSVHWSMLCATTTTPNDKETGSVKMNKNILSFQAHGILELGGHSGKILDVAVHSDRLNHHYAASLDSKGKVLFWSLSTLNQCTFGLPMVNPSWKVCGQLVIGSSRPKYTSILWAPSVVQDDFIVLMGNACGIDCYILEFLKDEVEAVICHHICTLPCHVHHATGPRCISAIPFPSNCSQNSFNSTFLLLGVWMGSFEALSWEITVHSSLISKSSCGCEDGCVNISKSLMRFEHTMSGKKYCVLVDPCASEWPQLHAHDQITSAATVYTGSSNYSLPMKHDFVSDARYSGYHIATGYLDGTVKLWKSNSAKTLSPSCQWELVGAFASDGNPVSALSLTDCGRKIATMTTFSDSTTSMLRIWECMHLLGSGSTVLEHTIPFDNHVVALRWLASGSGQFLLGVCMPNKIQLFTQRRCGGQSLFGSQTKMQIWCCLATTLISPPVNDFVWGPGAAPLVIHEYYFSLLEPWVYKMDIEPQTNNSCSTVGEPISHWTRKAEGYYIATFTDNFRMNGLKGSSMGEISRTNHLECLAGVNLHSEAHMKLRSRTSILELADKLIVPLPVYHPESLIANIFSGNWKRARFALRFLTKYFATERRSSKMKFALPAPEVLLSDYYEGQEVGCSTVKEQCWSGLDGSSSKAQLGFSAFAFGSEYDVSHLTTSSPDSELIGFNDQMEMLQTLGYMTEIEKLQTCSILDLLNEISGSHSASVYGSLDEPGRRFWVPVRFQMMLTHKKSGQLPSMQDLMIDSKTICWAFHSDCQENLFSSLLPNEASWSDMRAIGFGFWFTDATKLRTKMEKLARFQYLKNKDPKSCALLYIALNRVQVLAGLFKISKDEKDKPLVGFLSRNFQEENNKAAALKNAYVLMGRHQLELAIAFFLLGGDTSSAITVCAKNLRDEQLALVICRLTDGPGGPVKRHLVSSYLLPTAVEKGDSWLQSLFEWENGNYSQSFLAMLGTQRDSMSLITSSSISFLDPSIGQYCMLLASKNSLRNAVGEQKAAVLSKWATHATATALNRSGLPVSSCLFWILKDIIC